MTMPITPLSCIYGTLVIPQRYVLMVMLHMAMLNSYHLRTVLNIAITEMVQPINETREHDSCPEFKYEKLDIEGGTYDWPNWLEAFVLYSFYIGYIIGHIPGGWLADKLGPRHVLGGCILISSLSTLLLPIFVQYGSYEAAIWLRAILGMAQGPVFPAISSYLQNWAPYSERGFLGGVAFSGGNLGTFSGNLFTGTIIRFSGSWPMAFYVWGFLALLWYVASLLMTFSKPTTHPFITDMELDYLNAQLKEERKFKVPWLQLISSMPIWAIFFGTFGDCVTYFTLVTNLPKYMKDILKLDLQSNGTFTALPFLGLWLSSIAFSRLADLLMNKHACSILTLRKVYTAIGNLAPSVFTLFATYVGCSRVGAITMYVIGLSLNATVYSGVILNVNDISRHYAGIIMSFCNGLASTSGILGPWMVGHLTPNGTLEEWKFVFWIMFGICTGTTCVFLIFAKAERQPWDFPTNGDE